eukprot:SAG31_NODE_1607_length_7760_cov_3.640386_4_plen_682_part_00
MASVDGGFPPHANPISQIRHAKPGADYDPMVLLSQRTLELPPQNYNLRQYTAPPPWQLAGTGGYKGPKRNLGPGKPPDPKYDVVRDSKEDLRRMLDEQVKEKAQRKELERRQRQEDERRAGAALPSYFSSRGGGGEPTNKSPSADTTPRSDRAGGEDPGGYRHNHRYVSGSTQLTSPRGGGGAVRGLEHNPITGDTGGNALPLHGRRASQIHHQEQQDPFRRGGNVRRSFDPAQDQGGVGRRGLSKIEEEKSIAQQLYQPLSPQHARFRLAHADPELQDQMMKKEREKSAMREMLAAQIAEKEARRAETNEQRRQAEERDAMEERLWNEQIKNSQGNNYTPAKGYHNEQQSGSQGSPYGKPPAHWSDATVDLGAAVAIAGSAGTSGYQQPDSARSGGPSRMVAHQQPIVVDQASLQQQLQLPRPPSLLGYQPVLHGTLGSVRSENSVITPSALGTLGKGSTWNSKGGASSGPGQGTVSSAGYRSVAGAGRALDSLSELHSLCKDLLQEQSELRTQLGKQTEVVHQLQAIARRGPPKGSRSEQRKRRVAPPGSKIGANRDGRSIAAGPKHGRRATKSTAQPKNVQQRWDDSGGGGRHYYRTPRDDNPPMYNQPPQAAAHAQSGYAVSRDPTGQGIGAAPQRNGVLGRPRPAGLQPPAQPMTMADGRPFDEVRCKHICSILMD